MTCDPPRARSLAIDRAALEDARTAASRELAGIPELRARAQAADRAASAAETRADAQQAAAAQLAANLEAATVQLAEARVEIARCVVSPLLATPACPCPLPLFTHLLSPPKSSFPA